jgi:hypothetical protein
MAMPTLQSSSCVKRCWQVIILLIIIMTAAILFLTRALAAEHNEAETLVQLEAKARALNHAQQQHAAEVQALASQHSKDKVSMEGRIRSTGFASLLFRFLCPS